MIRAATRRLACLALLAILGACSATDTVVFKGLAGESPGEKGTIPQAIAEGPLGIGAPAFGGTVFRKPVSSEAGPPALKGPIAALRERALRWKARVYDRDDELQRGRRALGVHYAAYKKAVDGLGLRDKKLLPDPDAAYRKNMAEARARLRRVNAELLKLNVVAAKTGQVAAEGETLLLEVKGAAAGSAKSAPPERAAAAALEKEVEETAALARKMQAEIRADIVKHSAYSNEQARGLDQLAAIVERNAPPVAAAPPPRPFVRIRFAAARVAYRRELYQALKAALDKRPDLYFEVVGAAPDANAQGRALGRAQEVMFAMAEMGVPPTRMRVTAVADASLRADEVRLYAR